MDIDSTEKNISVNKVYKGKRLEPAIIVKFVCQDTKVASYPARSMLKNKSLDINLQMAYISIKALLK